MRKKLTLAQRCAGDDILAVVRDLRANPPGQTDDEYEELLELLYKRACPVGLLMWAALCGSLKMKRRVATNSSIRPSVLKALMMDVEMAPWYVFDMVSDEKVFAKLMRNLYGKESPYPDASNLDDVISESMNTTLQEHWAQFIPKVGACDIMQAELVRILWRFGQIWNYGVAYKLNYDDQMFIVLNDAINKIPRISAFSRNVLRALLRWTQISQRGLDVPPINYEPYFLMFFIVDVYLRKVPDAVPFNARTAHGWLY